MLNNADRQRLYRFRKRLAFLMYCDLLILSGLSSEYETVYMEFFYDV